MSTLILFVIAIFLLPFIFLFKKKELHDYFKVMEETELLEFLSTKKAYMSSEAWYNKRATVLKRDNYCCQVCGATSDLHVHHMSGYIDIPLEPISCLITLCATHHTAEHEKHGYPKSLLDYMTWNVEKPANNVQHFSQNLRTKTYTTKD